MDILSKVANDVATEYGLFNTCECDEYDQLFGFMMSMNPELPYNELYHIAVTVVNTFILA